MSGDDDERRHAQRLILVLPSCPSSSDMALQMQMMKWKGWKHPPSYINQSKWMDYCATLEASRTYEIELDMQRMVDNLADIKLKLTCTNSIAAMNIIYMGEQMKYHRATEQRAMDRWIAR